MLLEGIVSFKMSSHARANVRITNEKNKTKIPMKGLKWENKMYKLKRSISHPSVNFKHAYCFPNFSNSLKSF